MLSSQVLFKPKGPPKELERLNTQNKLTTKAKATITGNKITVITPDVMIRPKQKLIVVIDVSDSMNVKVKSGNDKSNRVSVLHLVKHCIKTLISSLNDDDELALITYSDYAHTIRDLTQMTIENKRIMSSLVDSMIAGGKTNLYDGLKHAFNITERESGSVLLFNGGVPNVHPRNGELEELRLYKNHCNRSELYFPTIHTFGFSNEFNHKLLYDISIVGQGMFCYIPCWSMLGTVFIHAISNLLSIYGHNAKLITQSDGVNKYHDVGFVSYGQPKYIQIPEGKAVALMVTHDENVVTHDINPGRAVYDCHSNNSKLLFELIKLLRQLSVTPRESLIDEAITELNKCFQSEYKDSILNDLAKGYDTKKYEDYGEIRKAILFDNYYTWGEKYIYTLLRAHELQIITNSKDKSLSTYGGKLFSAFKDNVSDIFNKEPLSNFE